MMNIQKKIYQLSKLHMTPAFTLHLKNLLIETEDYRTIISELKSAFNSIDFNLFSLIDVLDNKIVFH